MAKLENNGEPKKVPLVYYDPDGTRHVVGDAEAQLVDGQLQVSGRLDDTFTVPNDFWGSISLGPYSEPERNV